MARLEDEVSARIRAIKTEFQIDGNRGLADLCKTTPSAVNNWLIAGGNLPRVPEMILLCERTGLTLDWIYRGQTGLLDPVLAIRLSKRVDDLLAQ